jgi:hypothetical protein
MPDRQPDADAPPILTPWTAPDRRAEDDEPMGGDPPCWAHLFEDEADPSPS